MLDKARSLYETLKANWIVGANKDQFQLALYLSVQNEYDSGNAKEGLLAKISAESNYDEKLTKANYVKARVSELMSKRNEIASLMDSIQSYQDAIENFQDEVVESVTDSVTDSDRAAVERFIQDQIFEATKEVSDRIATRHIFAISGFIVSFFLLAPDFFTFESKFILPISIKVAAILLIIFSVYRLIGNKELIAQENKIKLEIRSSFSEQDKVSKAAEIAKQRVERHKNLSQEKLGELTTEQARLQQELHKLIN